MRGLFALTVALASAWATATSVASAGQLHVIEYGVKEALAQHRAIVVGEVRAADPRSIEITVVQIFAPRTSGPALSVGQGLKWAIYQGVEWTDPRKSPIDHRLRGAMSGPPIPGARVVLVETMQGSSVELLPAGAPLLRTLAILTAGDPAAALAKETRQALEVDLANPDLVALAVAELTRRGTLSPAILLRAEPRFLQTHYAALSSDEKRRFIEAALPAARTPTNRDRLWAVAVRALDATTIPAVAQLAALFRPRDVDDARRLDELRTELLSIAARAADKPADPQPDFSPFAEQLVGWAVKRPAYRRIDGDFARLSRHLDAAAKARVAEALLGAAYTSSHARPDDPDGWLLSEGSRLAAESPTPSMLTVLATIDPNLPRVTATKQLVMDTILRVSTAVVKAHPAQASRARDLVEPLLARPAPASEVALSDYRKIAGSSPVEPPRETTLELRPGETRRLSTGARVSFRRSAEAQGYELAIASVDETSFGLPAKDELDWYRELWLAPYLIVTKRLGSPASPRLSVRLVPQAKEPRILDQPEAFEQAKAHLHTRGFDEHVADDFDDSAGWLRYTAADKSGRKATVVIGTRTRTVVRSTPEK